MISTASRNASVSSVKEREGKRISDEQLAELTQRKLLQLRRERGIPDDGNAGQFKQTLDGSPEALIDVLFRGRARDQLRVALRKRRADSS